MDLKAAETFCTPIEDAKSASKTLLLCGAMEDWPDDKKVIAGAEPTIDAWLIFDLYTTEELLLMFPFLLLQHNAWGACRLRIFVVTQPDESKGGKAGHLQATLQEFLAAGGIVAAVKVIIMSEAEATEKKISVMPPDESMKHM